MQLPEFFKSDVAAVHSRHRELEAALHQHFRQELLAGAVLTGAFYDQLFERLDTLLQLSEGETFTTGSAQLELAHRQLPEGGQRLASLRELLQGYYQKPFNYPLLRDLCWRLAAGYQELAHVRPLTRQFETVAPSWVELRIEEVWFSGLSQAKKVMVELTLRVLRGPFAGLCFKQRMPYAFVVRVLAKTLGFPKYKGTHKNELVQCCFIGYLNTERADKPKVEFFETDSRIVAWTARIRKDRKSCPKQCSWTCQHCPLGYLRLREKDTPDTPWCPKGTHRCSFVRRCCSRCQQDQWFNPESASQVCLKCSCSSATHLAREERTHR